MHSIIFFAILRLIQRLSTEGVKDMSEAAMPRMSSAIDAAKKAPGQAWYKSKSLWTGLITATFINQFADLAIERVTGLDITDWGYKAVEAMDYNAHKPAYQEVDDALGISSTFRDIMDTTQSVAQTSSARETMVVAQHIALKNPSDPEGLRAKFIMETSQNIAVTETPTGYTSFYFEGKKSCEGIKADCGLNRVYK